MSRIHVNLTYSLTAGALLMLSEDRSWKQVHKARTLLPTTLSKKTTTTFLHHEPFPPKSSLPNLHHFTIHQTLLDSPNMSLLDEKTEMMERALPVEAVSGGKPHFKTPQLILSLLTDHIIEKPAVYKPLEKGDMWGIACLITMALLVVLELNLIGGFSFVWSMLIIMIGVPISGMIAAKVTP